MKEPIQKDSVTVVDSMLLSGEVIRLLSAYESVDKLKRKELIESNFKVSQILGSIAFLYERIRNTLDYKGDHLLRRNAIERVLKRQIWENKIHDMQKLTESLIKELIWARYVKNDSLSRQKIDQLSGVLDKYLTLFSLFSSNFSAKDVEESTSWFIGVLSSELEETLDPNILLK